MSTHGGSPPALRRFKPYPAYRDSGAEWLGGIPVHWECLALARVTVSRCDGPFGSGLKSEHYSGAGVRVVRLQNIGWAEFSDSDEAHISEAYARELGDHSVVAGDLLIAGLGDEGHPVGRACTAPAGIEPAMVKADCFRFRLDRRLVLSGFVAYQLSAAASAAAGSLGTGATRSRMNLTTTAARKVALPPLDEQHAIVAFLDRETARIDALVAKKERLIELLEEKRAALITRAVTTGLDPNAPMKDSGVEWLGEIPAHWDVEENRWLFRESDKRSEFGEEELLTVSHLTGVSRRSEKAVTMIEAESHEGYKICEAGELAINTMWAWMGALGVAREDGMVSPSYNVYRISCPDLNERYYDYLCRVPSHVTEIARLSKGIWSSRLRLYPEAFYEIRTPLPPMAEQVRVTAHLDHETVRIDALIAKVRDAIARLKELRTALVSAAVTGKIDVRDLA